MINLENSTPTGHFRLAAWGEEGRSREVAPNRLVSRLDTYIGQLQDEIRQEPVHISAVPTG